MKTIYETRGAAKEYCELAVDIYENCPHLCEYCYAKAKVERKNNIFEFRGPRKNIIEETKEYLDNHSEIYGKEIFLGFSSDPFPMNEDCTKTLDMIKLLKEYNCKIMLCTKSNLQNETIKKAIELVDSVGITISCGNEMAKKYEPNAALPTERLKLLKYAKECGCETWISLEPILEPNYIYALLNSEEMTYVNTVKLGKLNHMTLADLTGNEKDIIDWREYGERAIQICKNKKINYLIKDALKKELN